MKKAPLFILFVGYGNIFASLVTFIMLLSDSQSFNWQKIIYIGLSLIGIILGYHLLLGRNWARLIIFGFWLIDLGIKIFTGTSLSQIAFTIIIQTVCYFLLFSKSSDDFFSKKTLMF